MATSKPKVKDDFDAENEVKSNYVKFNVPGEDKILGTLIRVFDTVSTLNPGQINKNYDLKADYGSFHVLDDKKKLVEDPIEVKEGEIWTVGGKGPLDRQMANIKIGQKVGFKFIDEQASKTKGFAPAKLIKVFTPKNEDGTVKMDEEYLAELQNAGHDGF